MRISRSWLLAAAVLSGACASAQRSGLQAEVFEGRFATVLDLADREPKRVTDVDRVGIPEGVPHDFFGLILHGALRVEKAGMHTFHLASDDGSRLYVGKKLVINNDYAHSRQEMSVSVELGLGWQPILVAFFEGVGDARLDLQWAGPGFARQPIAPESLRQREKVVEWPRGRRAVSWLFQGKSGEPLAAIFASQRAFSPGELRFRAVSADRPGEPVPGTIACLSEADQRQDAPLAACTFPISVGTKAFRLDFPKLPGEFLRVDALGPDVLTPDDLRSNALLQIVVDARDAPELLPVGRQMVTTLGKNYGSMAKLLAGPKFNPPRVVRLTFRPGIKVPAFATGYGITLSREWFTKHPRDVGVVVHEVAHLLQRYPTGKPSWLIEGIADYVRHQAHLNDGWRVPTKPRPNWKYTQGYGVTTGFLLYVERHHAKTIVPTMNQALRAKAYRPELWKELTGKTVDELWQEYLKTAK